ncbi:hypothetical protein IE81DRAFT_121428 [Ceraceosorus guamensis]|uniref:Uncharacterized protein n=1 Tax=Ceraceosorus guamensis TaxID=1522189 RepID=A0A316VY42_9BASI|nr:hypothetical protein IE81DRAFT_121428 [Ceraceosorus guamensis]PWN42577.1 hypothetical protein IE81DRAFT_121428 [Ceraceosorus guamensis]
MRLPFQCLSPSYLCRLDLATDSTLEPEQVFKERSLVVPIPAAMEPIYEPHDVSPSTETTSLEWNFDEHDCSRGTNYAWSSHTNSRKPVELVRTFTGTFRKCQVKTRRIALAPRLPMASKSPRKGLDLLANWHFACSEAKDNWATCNWSAQNSPVSLDEKHNTFLPDDSIAKGKPHPRIQAHVQCVQCTRSHVAVKADLPSTEKSEPTLSASVSIDGDARNCKDTVALLHRDADWLEIATPALPSSTAAPSKRIGLLRTLSKKMPWFVSDRATMRQAARRASQASGQKDQPTRRTTPRQARDAIELDEPRALCQSPLGEPPMPDHLPTTKTPSLYIGNGHRPLSLLVDVCDNTDTQSLTSTGPTSLSSSSCQFEEQVHGSVCAVAHDNLPGALSKGPILPSTDVKAQAMRRQRPSLSLALKQQHASRTFSEPLLQTSNHCTTPVRRLTVRNGLPSSSSPASLSSFDHPQDAANTDSSPTTPEDGHRLISAHPDSEIWRPFPPADVHKADSVTFNKESTLHNQDPCPISSPITPRARCEGLRSRSTLPHMAASRAEYDVPPPLMGSTWGAGAYANKNVSDSSSSKFLNMRLLRMNRGGLEQWSSLTSAPFPFQPSESPSHLGLNIHTTATAPAAKRANSFSSLGRRFPTNTFSSQHRLSTFAFTSPSFSLSPSASAPSPQFQILERRATAPCRHAKCATISCAPSDEWSSSVLTAVPPTPIAAQHDADADAGACSRDD